MVQGYYRISDKPRRIQSFWHRLKIVLKMGSGRKLMPSSVALSPRCYVSSSKFNVSLFLKIVLASGLFLWLLVGHQLRETAPSHKLEFEISRSTDGSKVGVGVDDLISRNVNGSLASAPQADLSQGYFFPGQEWLSTDGDPIQAHGGCVLYDESRHLFFWYGENKDGQTYRLKDSLARVDLIGISVYSSPDLINWKYLGLALKGEPTDYTSDLHPSRVAERPKVVYNKMTDKFVMWIHVDDANYKIASLGVAISSNPEGPFEYIKRMRPHGFDSRDMTIFKDDDETAYVIYSSEMNSVLHIGRLSKDFTSVEGDFVRRLVGWRREAPAIFKYRKHYFMVTSGCTGWAPNSAQVHVSTSVMGEYEQLSDPCVGGSEEFRSHTFDSQGFYVLPLPGAENLFVYMGDRWIEQDLRTSLYVWLPLVLEDLADTGVGEMLDPKSRFQVKIVWHEKWKLPKNWRGGSLATA